MLSDFKRVFAESIAIDLGTANSLVYVPGRGVVLDEPSMVAIETDDKTRKVLAVGAKAKDMFGRAPENIEIIKPLRDGVVADFIAAEEMLRQFIRRVRSRLGFRKPRVLVCIPAGSTPVERRAVYESALAAGGRVAALVEEPVAAAIGAGLPVSEAQGSMVVDIGGGTTDIAVISLGGIMYANSIRVAGHAMDDAIARYVRRRHELVIGESSAEAIKIQAGTAVRGLNGRVVDVHIRGRDLRRGLPKEIVLGPGDIADALTRPIDDIVEAIQLSLEQLDPELAWDICERGICLTGGGSLLHRLDEELSERTGVRVFQAEAPLQSVIRGCGVLLEDAERFENFLIQPQ